MKWVSDIVRHSLPTNYPWYGNVREFEQCVRRVLLTQRYEPMETLGRADGGAALIEEIESGRLTEHDLVSSYCAPLQETRHAR